MKHLKILALAVMTASFAVPALAEDHDEHDEAHEIDLFLGYMEISERFVNLAGDTTAAVFFAVEGITEIHEERGEPAAAIAALQGILEQYPDNQAVRNVVRFSLRDIYLESDQADLALAELQLLIEENR